MIFRYLLLAALVVACKGSDPPPRTEATPQTSASAAQSAKAQYDEQFSHGIALGNIGGDSNRKPSASDGGLANGRIDPDEVRRVVRSQVAPIKACYEHALQKTPTLEGRVAVQFVIDRSGAVASASSHPSTTMSDTHVVDCVIAVFKSMKFPAPTGGEVSIVYPFDFRPGD
jgi:TonB family protein